MLYWIKYDRPQIYMLGTLSSNIKFVWQLEAIHRPLKQVFGCFRSLLW